MGLAGESRSMNQNRDDNLSVGGRTVERLDDVRERVASLETAIKSLASKEDVEKAKYALLVTWVLIGVSVLISIATFAGRALFP